MRAQSPSPASLDLGPAPSRQTVFPLSHFTMAGYYGCRPVPGTNGPRSNLQGNRDTVQEAADAREGPNIIRRSRGLTRACGASQARRLVSIQTEGRSAPYLSEGRW